MLPSLLVLAAFARAQAPAEAPCWRLERSSEAAVVESPGENLSFLYGVKAFSEVCAAGAVVANGTFFAGSEPLGDVIDDGQPVFTPHPRRFLSGPRKVDLGQRWGIGILKEGRALAVATGDDARSAMRAFLGGGGILLQNGVDVSSLNFIAASEWGPNFSRYEVLEAKRGRTALGFKTAAGKQTLYVLSVKEPPGVDVRQLAEMMSRMGATEAVFYDGGGARGFAAGGKCVDWPANPEEDANPTHIVIKACRASSPSAGH